MKKFMFVNRKAPYGTIYALESLEVVLIAATFDQDVSLVFVDDGVYELVKGQDTKGIGIKNHSKTYRALDGYDVEKLYVERESMDARGLTEDDLIVDVEVLVQRRDGDADGRAGRRPFLLTGRPTDHAAHRQQIARADHVAAELPAPGAAGLGAAADRGRRLRRHDGRRRRPRASPTRSRRLKVYVLQPDVEARGMAGKLIDGVTADRLRRLRRPGRRAPEQPILAVEPAHHSAEGDEIMGIEVNGTTYETDEEGYLVNLADWNEDIGKAIAKTENVDMSPNHWEVVNFLRDYYNEYQIAPAVRVLTKAIGKQLGAGQGQQQVPLRAVPLRPGEAGVQDRRPAEADRLRLGVLVMHRERVSTPRAAQAFPRIDTMSALSIAYAALFYVATASSSSASALKIRVYARTPAPLKIPTTPAPTTTCRRRAAHDARGGVLREPVQVEQVDVDLRLDVPCRAAARAAAPSALLPAAGVGRRSSGSSPSAPMPASRWSAGLAGLWARRFLVDRVRYISTPSDHLHLALLIAIGLSGLAMRFVRAHRHRRASRPSCSA